jgi:hypothetical protein
MADSQPDSFLRAIELALLSANDERIIMRRREVATLSEWQSRLNVMSDLIEQAAQLKSESVK